jgi:hypothetical protein
MAAPRADDRPTIHLKMFIRLPSLVGRPVKPGCRTIAAIQPAIA